MLNAFQLILAGPRLVWLSRNRGGGNAEQQQDACDLGCHGNILACFYAVDGKLLLRIGYESIG